MSTAKQIQQKIDGYEQAIDHLLDELRVAERVEDEARSPFVVGHTIHDCARVVSEHQQLIINQGIQLDELAEDTRDLRAILEVQRIRATNMYKAQERLIERVRELENVREGRIPKAARESWEDTPIESISWHDVSGGGYGNGLA